MCCRTPGHFRGVATVCTKLFGQTGAEVAVFGEKDWQQLQAVRRVARDPALPVRIVGVPPVREPDGLAMSSRNRFLSPVERALAPKLHAEMRRAAEAIAAGAPVAATTAGAADELGRAGFGVDYFALVEADTMRPLEALPPPGGAPARLVVAARLGAVRLLDNMAVPPGSAARRALPQWRIIRRRIEYPVSRSGPACSPQVTQAPTAAARPTRPGHRQS